MVAVGYRRESSASADVDSAYDYQGERLEAYGCQWIFGDRLSGRQSNRKGLDEALAKIGTGEADELVVTHIFRLGRTLDSYRIIQWLESKGAKITVLEGTANTQTAEGRAFLKMQLVLGEMEAELGVERQRIGWRNSIAKGRPRSKLFGYQIEHGRYVPDLTEIDGVSRFQIASQIVDKYFELRSFHALAEWVRSHPQWQVGAKQERPSIYPNGLRRWLCREALQGHVKLKGNLSTNTHIPLITEPDRIAEIEAIAGRRSGHSTARKHPYSGLVKCGVCGGQFVAQKIDRLLTAEELGINRQFQFDLANVEQAVRQLSELPEQSKSEQLRSEYLMYYRCTKSKRGQCDNALGIAVRRLDQAVQQAVTDNLQAIAEYVAQPITPSVPPAVLELQVKIDKLSLLKDDERVAMLIREMELEIKNHLQVVGLTPASVNREESLIVANRMSDPKAWKRLDQNPSIKSSMLRSLIAAIVVKDARVVQVQWIPGLLD